MDFSQLTLAQAMFDVGLGCVIGGAILLIWSWVRLRREGRSG